MDAPARERVRRMFAEGRARRRRPIQITREMLDPLVGRYVGYAAWERFLKSAELATVEKGGREYAAGDGRIGEPESPYYTIQVDASVIDNGKAWARSGYGFAAYDQAGDLMATAVGPGSVVMFVAGQHAYQTVNTAELTAIIQAVKFAHRRLPGPSRVWVRSDSQLSVSLVNGVKNTGRPHLKSLRDYARKLIADAKADGFDITVAWHPRELNARADALARLGIDKPGEEVSLGAAILRPVVPGVAPAAGAAPEALRPPPLPEGEAAPDQPDDSEFDRAVARAR
jgi:ribonuclease HI